MSHLTQKLVRNVAADYHVCGVAGVWLLWLPAGSLPICPPTKDDEQNNLTQPINLINGLK